MPVVGNPINALKHLSNKAPVKGSANKATTSSGSFVTFLNTGGSESKTATTNAGKTPSPSAGKVQHSVTSIISAAPKKPSTKARTTAYESSVIQPLTPSGKRGVRSLKMFGWLGAIAGMLAFLLLYDEMAALLFWIGLGMLIHAYSPWKDEPLWECFLTAKYPFRLSFLLILPSVLIFWMAHRIEPWFVRDLFEPLAALLLVVGIAALVAVTQASTTHGQPPSR
jgi:hypothetical protein